MANISRTIDVIFNGKDNITPATKKISLGLRSIEYSADFAVDKLDILADTFKKTTLATTAFATALGTLITIQFKEFESAWIDLDKIIEPTVDDIEGASEEVERLALKYGASMVEITRSTIDFKRAGFSLAEALGLVEGGLQLASAGNVDMATSTEFIIAIMKGFNLTLGDSQEVINTLNVLSDKYATTVEELGVALSRVAPTAKTAGLSMREAASLAVPIIEVFRSGEEAGTALRRGLIKLTDDAAPVQDALAMLKVQQRDTNGELRSGREILYDIAESFGDATESNKLFIASQLFGQRQAAKMIKVLDDWGYVMSIQTTKGLDDFTYTTDQVAKKLASTEVAIGRVTAAFELMSVRLGDRLEPGFKAALAGIAETLIAISSSVEEGLLDTILGYFSDFGFKVGVFFNDLAKAVPEALAGVDYTGLLRAFDDLVRQIGLSLGGLDLRKPEDLAKAIQFVIDTMESGIDTASGLLTVYNRIKNAILELIHNYNNLDADQKRIYGALLATADVMEHTGKIFGLLLSQFDSFGTVMASILVRVTGLFTLLSSEFELFSAVVVDQFTSIVKWVLKGLNFVTAGASKTIQENLKLVTKAHELARGRVIDAAQDMTSGYNRMIKGLEDVGDETGRVTELVRKFAKALKETPREISVDVKATLDEKSIDPEVAKMAKRIEELHAEKAARGDFNFITKAELEAEKDLTDFLQGKGIYAPRKDSLFDDSTIAKVEAQSIALKRDLKATAEAVDETSDVELNVPDDAKFKAAQDKLLKEIETNADIVEAQIKSVADMAESQADTISSIFESVSDSITSTGDILSDLYSQLASGTLDFVTQGKIQRQISAEEERRQEAFDLQKQLTTAQIDLIKQRASAMAAGDPMITVSGDGLQPHLEAFMWEILSAIQVRVNEDYGNFLLGIGAQ